MYLRSLSVGKLKAALILATVAVALPRSLSGQVPAADSGTVAPVVELSPAMQLVKEQVKNRMVPRARWSKIADVGVELTRVYEYNGWRPLWISRGRPTRAALGTLAYLGRLDTMGLDPADFDSARLDSMAASVGDSLDALGQARFEAVLSVATARVLTALRWGRVRQPKGYPVIRRPRSEYDVAFGIYGAAHTPDPVPVFETAEPPYAAYRELQRAFDETRKLASSPILRSVSGEQALMAGMTYDRVPELRHVLRRLGALPDSLVRQGALAADTLFDEELSNAVRRFQKENGRAQTGKFDAGTKTAMRNLFVRRARDAELALERWRWLPRKAQGRALIVNIPEFQLHAYEDVRHDARPAFSMKVVVGKDEENRFTPMFSDEMEHIIFSPYWEVPQTIAVDEIVPKASTDPEYLSRNRYILVKGYSDSAPRVVPDSTSLAAVGTSVRVRQLPGDYNSLGRVKFMLPNHLNIYLHDTNEKHLFQQARRAYSHGCVRVAEPTKLAEWVLRSDSVWTSDKMRDAMKAKDPEKVELAEPIPVMIVYHTAAIDDGGVLRAYRDVYEFNKDLTDSLRTTYAPK